MSESNRRLTAVDISRELSVSSGVQLHPMTVRRRLAAAGLNGRIARRKPFISAKNRQRRLQWARDHANWTVQDWKKVVWSDESKFSRTGSDGRLYIRRRIGEEFDPRCTTATVKHGGGSVMVWAAFSTNGAGPITRIEGIMDSIMYRDILANNLQDAADGLPLSVQASWEFQHDNDPKHTSRLVKAWLSDNRIRTMDWPAQSPDLNPIENLWNWVERDIKRQQPTSLNELFTTIKESWAAIPPSTCEKLVESMPRRCAAVIKAKGFATKY
jgi:hypothetical protein